MKRRTLHRVCAGFTLFEMIVVIMIFVLMAGGIYTTVSAAVQASATLSEENLRTQRLNAYVSLLRRTFHNLPATAKISGGVRAGGEGIPEIVLRDAPGIFAWGSGGPSAGTIVLAARPRLGGGREFSLLLMPSSLGEVERRDALDRGRWLRLVPDMRSARWRFFNPSLQEWVEEWPEDGDRPPLVELSLELLGEEIPRSYVFWLPPVKEAAAATQGEPSDEVPQVEVDAGTGEEDLVP
jgi:prepilin-type N-terminal cleavage/methylation domain-containing protein